MAENNSLYGLLGYISPTNQEWAPWPVRAARSGLAGLMAPGDAYQGNLPMTGQDGRTSLEAIGRASDLGGLLTLGAGAAPAEAGFGLSAGLNGLRQRYAAYLSEAAGGKDPARIKLTPERIDVAKELMRTAFGMFPEGKPNPVMGSVPSPYRQTEQAKAAADFAARARLAGIDDVRVKFADGPGGSVYVRTGDHGTVRFADHPPPTGWVVNPATGKSELQTVGGYSKELGRRHMPATVDASSGTKPAYDFLAALLRGDGV